jgi:hypothetical protein
MQEKRDKEAADREAAKKNEDSKIKQIPKIEVEPPKMTTTPVKKFPVINEPEKKEDSAKKI